MGAYNSKYKYASESKIGFSLCNMYVLYVRMDWKWVKFRSAEVITQPFLCEHVDHGAVHGHLSRHVIVANRILTDPQPWNISSPLLPVFSVHICYFEQFISRSLATERLLMRLDMDACSCSYTWNIPYICLSPCLVSLSHLAVSKGGLFRGM